MFCLFYLLFVCVMAQQFTESRRDAAGNPLLRRKTEQLDQLSRLGQGDVRHMMRPPGGLVFFVVVCCLLLFVVLLFLCFGFCS